VLEPGLQPSGRPRPRRRRPPREGRGSLRAVAHAAARLPLRALVAGRGHRGPPRPLARARTADREPRRDPPLGRHDDLARHPPRASVAPPSGVPGPRLGVRPPLRVGGDARRRATRSGCWSTGSWWPSSRRARGAGASRLASATGSSASAAAGSQRSRCAPAPPSCRSPWWKPGDLPQAPRAPAHRAADRGSVLPGDADWPARRGSAALAVTDRVLRPGFHVRIRNGGGGRPGAGLRAIRAGPGPSSRRSTTLVKRGHAFV
jgi:hypothetical protein